MSPNQSPMPDEASAVEIKMPVDEQTSGAVTAQHSTTYQQPIFFGTAQQSSAPVPAHQHAASYDSTQQASTRSMPHHYHTTSLGSTLQSLPLYPSHQHSLTYGNQYPSPQADAQYPSSYYSMTPYPSQPLPLYPLSSYEHQPMPAHFQPSQAPQYYDNPEVNPYLEGQQTSTNPFYAHPDPFMAQSSSGNYRPSTPPMDAGPSSSHQFVPEFSNVTSPPIQQPTLSIEQPQTPTSSPLHHAPKGSDPIEGNNFNSPRAKTMKHLTCYYWADKGNCRNGDNCFYAHTWNTEGQASKPIRKEPGSTSAIAPSTSLSIVLTMMALEPAVAGKNAQKENPAYIDWSRVHAPFNPPRPKSPIHPKIQAQIDDIRKKNTPVLSLEPRLQRLQEAEMRSIQMRAIEAAGAAAHQARLDARMKALDELIERLERNKTSNADTATSESTAPTLDSSSEPTSSPQESKAIKLDTDTTTNTAADTSTVMTDLVAENQALRSAVQDMAHVVSSVMASNRDLRFQRNQLHDSLFHKILKVPAEFQDVLLKPFADSTEGHEESRNAEELATMSMYAVRTKMIEMGNGGLLTAWDRDFCSSTDRVTGGMSEGCMGSTSRVAGEEN
ncbi:MAG: hypothetical protein L6R38_008085 [Xanthoria sp. 2 TBL-2021]|nr:MAG: hypothetical protein L6R38_008085 [Xanthoria sp. 2 TBL-2021]